MLSRAWDLARVLCQRGAPTSQMLFLQIESAAGIRRNFSILVSNNKSLCVIPLKWNKSFIGITQWNKSMSNSKNNNKPNIIGDQKKGNPEVKNGKSTDNVKISAAPTATPTKQAADEIVVKEIIVKGGKIVVNGNAAAPEGETVTGVVITKDLSTPSDKKKPVEVATPAAAAPKKQRKRFDHFANTLERNFITPMRAMSEFLLKPSDLESLPKTKRRSPYELEPPIIVHWRKDVEAVAIKVWGSMENLRKELLKRDIERKTYQQNVFTQKRRLRDYRREMGTRSEVTETETGLMGRSGRVVIAAVAINASNFLFKLFAWFFTGSNSMFSECIHSLADTVNQLILAYGIHKSVQEADTKHPYGYSNMRYVASLISGVGIFCVGAGLSVYHGVDGLLNPHPVEDYYWAYYILGGSTVSEGATLLMAFNSIRKGAREASISVKEYVLRGQDPSVNVVMLEDSAAVLGVLVAAGCMGLSSMTQSPLADSVGSIVIGGLLAGVASFIIYSNVAALVGRSIQQDKLDDMNAVLESDVMIRAIHDVKGIDMGNNLVRYKAEMDFDGRELSRAYLDKLDLNVLLEEVNKFKTIDELEEFLLKHGENIVDLMGGEIDRIELKLRTKFPQIRHCDLEIL